LLARLQLLADIQKTSAVSQYNLPKVCVLSAGFNEKSWLLRNSLGLSLCLPLLSSLVSAQNTSIQENYHNKIPMPFFDIESKIAHQETSSLETEPIPSFVPAEDTDKEVISLLRVLNGTIANIKDYPFTTFVYALLGNSGEACTGSLISSKVIVTAAHCLFDPNQVPFSPSKIYVSAGTNTNINDAPSANIFRASKIVPHPSYDPRTALNDVGLIFLTTSVPSSIATPTKIYTGEISDSLPVAAAGWGLTSNDPDAQVADVLSYVNLNISSSAECKILNPVWNGNSGYTICTLIQNGKDTCYGDSGGPLAVLNTNQNPMPIVGLTSIGNSPGNDEKPLCGQPGGTAYYTNLKNYLSWINQQMNDTTTTTGTTLYPLFS
ncbi:hypothetical protein BB560_004840, partial [Smittium megazygosporum]